MFGEIDVIMRRDDRDLGPFARFGPIDALARMPARLNARRGRRHAADKLRVQSFDPVRVHHRLSRSEEHTSELQSLMRISSAVFCLKTKNTTKHRHIHARKNTN